MSDQVLTPLALKEELTRQKIMFEAELQQQRELFSSRLATLTQQLENREADCRHLQTAVTLLGRKLDSLTSDNLTSGTGGASRIERLSIPSRQRSLMSSNRGNLAPRPKSTGRQFYPESSGLSFLGASSYQRKLHNSSSKISPR